MACRLTRLAEANDDSHAVQIHHPLQLRREWLDLRLVVGQFVLVRPDASPAIQLPLHRSRHHTTDNLPIHRSLALDGPPNLTLAIDLTLDLIQHRTQAARRRQPARKIRQQRFQLAVRRDRAGHQPRNMQRHLCLGEGPDVHLLDAGGEDVVAGHQAGSARPANHGPAQAEIRAPILGPPLVEQALQADLGFGVEAVVAEDAVVGREGEDHLRGVREDPPRRLLRLDGAEEADDVGQHDAVSQFGRRVDRVDGPAGLTDGGEWDDVVGVPAEAGVDVVDQVEDVLLAAAVEGDDDQLRASAAVLRVYGLVVGGGLG